MRFIYALALLSLFASSALGAGGIGGAGHDRLNGGIAVGATQFTVVSPDQDLKINGGSFFSLSAEKPFYTLPLYVEAAVSYLHATGSGNYNFTNAAITYLSTNANLVVDQVQLDLGLRYKILEYLPVNPYLEIGATGGFFQLTYSDSMKTPAFIAQGSDFKMVDGVLDIGFYGEAGAEINFTNEFGTRLSYRYYSSSTRPLETLKSQDLRYNANIYILSLFWHF